jgi:hypothetical protein
LSSATASDSLAGAQRSMVDSIVYTFSEPVTIAGAAGFTFTVINDGSSDAGGIAPSYFVRPIPDTNDTQWVVTFSGSMGNSVVNGAYTVTINPAAVTSANGIDLTAGETDTFFRLYGDLRGTMSVTGADNTLFGRAFGSTNLAANFVAALDYSDSGQISGADNTQFGRDFGLVYSGFTPTI